MPNAHISKEKMQTYSDCSHFFYVFCSQCFLDCVEKIVEKKSCLQLGKRVSAYIWRICLMISVWPIMILQGKWNLFLLESMEWRRLSHARWSFRLLREFWIRWYHWKDLECHREKIICCYEDDEEVVQVVFGQIFIQYIDHRPLKRIFVSKRFANRRIEKLVLQS